MTSTPSKSRSIPTFKRNVSVSSCSPRNSPIKHNLVAEKMFKLIENTRNKFGMEFDHNRSCIADPDQSKVRICTACGSEIDLANKSFFLRHQLTPEQESNRYYDFLSFTLDELQQTNQELLEIRKMLTKLYK